MADLRGDQLPAGTAPLTDEPAPAWQSSEYKQFPARDFATAIVPIVAVTASRNFADSDNGKILRCTSSVTLTMPTTVTTGVACMVLNRSGGNVTIAAGSGLALDGDATVGDDQFATVVKDAATEAIARASG